MYQIEMVDENILVQKVESNKNTDFAIAGDYDNRGAIYKVCFSNHPVYTEGQLVMLAPGSYDSLPFENEVYIAIEASDVIATVKEAK